MWTPEETNEGVDLVWSQPEVGIGPSALKGNANLQNVNIATEPGTVMAAFARTNQNQHTAISSGTLTPDGDTLFDTTDDLHGGVWIQVTSSTVSSITATTNPTTATLDYLAVAGGGGGGGADSGDTNQEAGGGGGGGGEVLESTAAFSVGSYSVTIGAGGTAGIGNDNTITGAGSNGEDTVIAGIITANGGGGGGAGKSGTTFLDGLDGGNGGGGGGDETNAASGTGGTGDQYDGGAGSTNGNSGGGGGAGEAGEAASGDGGDGGAGALSSISGVSMAYGGGGGGGDAGGVSPSRGQGGIGGGGDGGAESAGSAGDINTGGGGGGAGSTDQIAFDGGDGGSGIAVISYTTGEVVAFGGTVTYTATKTIHTFTEDGVFEVVWINPGGYYFVSYEDDSGQLKLSETFDPYGDNVVTHGTTGSITYDVVATPGKAIDKATEKYQTSTGTEYRYYILDDNGRTWVYDTLVYETTLADNNVGITWSLTDPYQYSDYKPKGMDVLNGQLMLISSRAVLCKPTVTLGMLPQFMTNGWLTNPYDNHPNYAMTGSQGTLLYTDGNFIGEIFPTTSLVTSVANLQSYASYTMDSNVGTISTLLGGSIPSHIDGTRLPVVFFASEGGTIASNLTPYKVYYIQYDFEAATFQVYDNLSGGTAKTSLETGATGTQYFTTFYPVGSEAGPNGSYPLVQFSPQRVNLPFYETATKLLEVGNTILIGCKGNIVYPWNQVDALPSDVITLPEDGVETMINVNNTAYIFAGDKGNIYVTNNVVASLALKIPDYTAGVPGTPNSYIEPTFTWGDAIFCRGRVYCSILDQNATKAGNCGGVWSFIPSENIDPSQEVGMALRLENQNSYGDYDGYAPILINDKEQNGKSPKYWAAWQDSYDDATANFGIDYSTENPVTKYVVETDLLATGTFLQKRTFEQLEYKLAVPLAAGDSVQLYWRTDPTGAWTSAGTADIETDNPVSGYYEVNFEKTQWTQIRAEITTSGVAATSTFVPLKEIRLR